MLQWKRIRGKDGIFHRAFGRNFTFKVYKLGGFTTPTEYILDVYYLSRPVLYLHFFKLRDAKTWAEQFDKEGEATITTVMVIGV